MEATHGMQKKVMHLHNNGLISHQSLEKYKDGGGDHACLLHINGEVRASSSLMEMTTWYYNEHAACFLLPTMKMEQKVI